MENFLQLNRIYLLVKKKIYLNVPYSEKDEAKKLGAKWDAKNKKWYINTNNKNKIQMIGHWGN